MKIKPLLYILTLALLTVQCKKELEPKDYPCADHVSEFTCKINGEPFINRGFDSCGGFNVWYDRNTGNLSISGTDCKAEIGEPWHLSFYLFGAFQTGKYEPIWSVSLSTPNNLGLFNYHDSTLSGYVSVDQLILDNYSEDYTGSVVSGSFEFTLWNPTLNDTAYITDGSFCMPF